MEQSEKGFCICELGGICGVMTCENDFDEGKKKITFRFHWQEASIFLLNQVNPEAKLNDEDPCENQSDTNRDNTLNTHNAHSTSSEICPYL